MSKSKQSDKPKKNTQGKQTRAPKRIKDKNMKDQIKSNFLNAEPNTHKQELVEATYNRFLTSINKFIHIFENEPNCYLYIFNLDYKASLIGQIESKHRDENLGSAFSQQSAKIALDKMHGKFVLIKRNLYGFAQNRDKSLIPFVESTAVLNACITNTCPIKTLEQLIVWENESIAKSNDKKKAKLIEEKGSADGFKPSTTSDKLKFYESTLKTLKAIPKDELDFLIKEVRFQFFDRLKSYKTPVVTHAPIQLDSRTCDIQKASDSSKFDFFLSMKVAKTDGVWNSRVNIPLLTSGRCKKRMKKFENSQPSVWIDDKRRVRVSVPVKVEVPKPASKTKQTKIIGIDLGIKKIFSLDDGSKFGTFKGLDEYYMQTCGNKLAERSKLRNQMRKYQKELKTLKNMTDEESNERKKILRKRISVLAKKLEGKKKLKKLLNKYKNKETTCICSAIKEVVAYIKNLDTKVLVVLENLDVNDFKLGRENNRMVSMWSRAKIVKKLEETLIAEGIEVVYVDPAYTSQACPKCHNVNKKNRDGEEFLCTCCGHQADADNNAGVNISKRYGDIEVSEVVKKYAHNNTLKHKEMRKIFAKRHREYLKNAKNGELNIN